jgi:hypothetical protein
MDVFELGRGRRNRIPRKRLQLTRQRRRRGRKGRMPRKR